MWRGLRCRYGPVKRSYANLGEKCASTSKIILRLPGAVRIGSASKARLGIVELDRLAPPGFKFCDPLGLDRVSQLSIAHVEARAHLVDCKGPKHAPVLLREALGLKPDDAFQHVPELVFVD